MRLQRPAMGFLLGFGLAALIGGVLASPGAGLSGKSDRQGEEPQIRRTLEAKTQRA